MIEREVYYEDIENRKGSIFYVKGNTPKEFFEQVEQVAEEINRISGKNLKPKYDIMIFDLKDTNQPIDKVNMLSG